MAAWLPTMGWADGRAPHRYHFSVDDVLGALIDVAESRQSLFEQPFFAVLRRLHDEFGAAVHLYCFYRARRGEGWRTLAEVPASTGATLRANPWLHLGPHALDADTPPYRQTIDEQVRALDAIYAEFDRFAPGASRSPWVRLHHFSEAYELAPYFRARGVEALLTTDKDAVSYRISAAARAELQARGRIDYAGIGLIRTHFRMEGLVAAGLGASAAAEAVDAVLSRQGLTVLMTHECEIERPAVQAMTEAVLRHLTGRGATSV